MSSLPPPSSPENKENKKSSLLSDILKASQSKESGQKDAPSEPEKPAMKEIKKEPISLGLFMRLIGSLLFISIIFFGSFLAYIAFNPSQAVFFVNTFNIDPNDINNLLKKLINGSFGFVMIIVSVAWIVSLFRAFWTPKELKRKRLLSWLLAFVVGIFLFLILAFWGYLFRVVGATDYSNPSGTILIYDQALYMNEEYKDNARLYNTTNLIGPIDIFFDIRGNAELIAKNNLYIIEGFDLDFDGAICTNGKSSIQGSNPEQEQSLSCRFEERKIYNLIGSYSVRTRDGEVKTVPMVLPNIEMRGTVAIRTQTNNRGQQIITLDGSSMRNLGKVRWLYKNGNEVVESSITEMVTPIAQGICLKVFEDTGCDRIFLIQDKNSKPVDGSIYIIRDTTDKNNFRLTLSGVTLNPNEILDIEWLIDGQNIACKGSAEYCDFRFNNYGRKNIRATLTLSNGEKYNFDTELMVNEPLNIVRNIKVFNNDGTLLNDSSTYDGNLRAFILKNSVVPPESLVFDARDIVPSNPGYEVSSILWRISNGKTIEERRGEKISIEFNEPLRYTVDAIYTFKKNVPGEKDIEDTLKETIVVDVERRSLMPRLNIAMSSDYVPAIVTVDASQSESESGEIKKFIFDFGEGRPPAEGDAIQQYSYTQPGEKTITLTIIAEDGEKTSLKKTIVLKDQVRTVGFSPSIDPGIAGNTIDFEAIGTTGQIEEYIWNFGDNTTVSREYATTHTYSTPGIYNIELTIVYHDGTRQSKKRKYEVIAAP